MLHMHFRAWRSGNAEDVREKAKRLVQSERKQAADREKVIQDLVASSERRDEQVLIAAALGAWKGAWRTGQVESERGRLSARTACLRSASVLTREWFASRWIQQVPRDSEGIT